MHCAAGMSRSPTIIISYLMRALNMSLLDAFAMVKHKRSCIFPNNGFIKQLILYENTLFGKTTISMDEYTAWEYYNLSVLQNYQAELSLKNTEVSTSNEDLPVQEKQDDKIIVNEEIKEIVNSDESITALFNGSIV